MIRNFLLAGDPILDNLMREMTNFPSKVQNLPLGSMRTDVSETEKEYLYEIELPGYTKENVSISLDKNILKISAEKKEENKETKTNYTYKEIVKGKVERSYALRENIDRDNIKAKMEDGILKVTIPKKEAEKITNKIEIE